MAHGLDSPPLVVALAMLTGAIAQVVARHIAVPAIVLLVAASVVLGPDVTNVIRPASLGHGLSWVVGFAVAVILFEGGLNLDFRALRRQQTAIRRLVLLGAVITSIGGAAFAHWLLGWDYRRAFLFGTLVIVTGPTVITPILRRIHARPSVETILEAEGIFIDAVGATIAIVALEVLLAPKEARLGLAVFGVLRRVAVGGLVGLAAGALFALVLRFRGILPDGLVNVSALAVAIAVFHVSNSLVPESGILAVIVAGAVVGNTQSHELGDLREFKEQLTLLLVATIFVLLTADVRVAEVVRLGWRGALTVLALIVVIRPLDVLASTWGTKLDGRERLFLAWVAPRGIVAAAVATLFAERMDEAGVEGGSAMRALVFLVIVTTVVVQGMSAGVVASLLGVRMPRDAGYVILGADVVARAIGDALRVHGDEIVFIDSNADAARAAEEAGFKVVFGDGLDERALVKSRAETRRGCIGATPNESVNFLFSSRVSKFARHVATYVAIDPERPGVSAEMVDQLRGRVLFVDANSLRAWGQVLGRGQAKRERWRAESDDAEGTGTFDALSPMTMLPLACSRDGVARPVTRAYRARKDDVVELAIASSAEAEAKAWLEARGWTRLEPDSGQDLRAVPGLAIFVCCFAMTSAGITWATAA